MHIQRCIEVYLFNKLLGSFFPLLFYLFYFPKKCISVSTIYLHLSYQAFALIFSSLNHIFVFLLYSGIVVKTTLFLSGYFQQDTLCFGVQLRIQTIMTMLVYYFYVYLWATFLFQALIYNSLPFKAVFSHKIFFRQHIFHLTT